MSNQTKYQKNVATVLVRMIDYSDEYEDFAEFLTDRLDSILDEYHSMDGFGTEGDSDPRGDFRDGKWTMKKVQLGDVPQ
jgi:hypothetical protein